MRGLLVVAFAMFLLACSNGGDASKDTPIPEGAIPIEEFQANKLARIQELEVAVLPDLVNAEDLKKRQLMVAYSEWGNQFHDHPSTPEYLFQAGRLAMELGRPKKAIAFFTDLHDGFPTFKKRTEAAYLVGFIYDNILNDRIMAERAYDKVIELYPDTEWATTAEAMKSQLYMTDDQLIEMLKEKNQDQ